VIFLLCAAGVLYVLAGYPVLLALLARTKEKVPVVGWQQPTVSVLLPAHNGERWMAAKLDTIFALDYPREKLHVLVIADGCTDRTVEIARQYPVEVIELATKSGKAVALSVALKSAHGEILFFTDVRQPLEPDALQHLVNRFADPNVGVVTGELIIRDGTTHEEANVGLYWKYEKLIRKELSRLDSVLGATGAIYAMRRSLAKPLPAGTLLDDVHQPMNAFFAGYRIVMEDRAKAYDISTGLETEFWRKVRTQAGIYQLIGQFPQLLWPGTRMWLHFFSYKFGRLMLPWMLVGMAISTFWLPEPWRKIAALGQIAFYGLAIANRWVPAGLGLVKKLSAAVSAFVVLVGAAGCASAILVVPPERLWRTK
jgi:cellulose synthase/poly-beta-1,6-N-acetylglucosamine synthase-like glycosyltransferase